MRYRNILTQSAIGVYEPIPIGEKHGFNCVWIAGLSKDGDPHIARVILEMIVRVTAVRYAVRLSSTAV